MRYHSASPAYAELQRRLDEAREQYKHLSVEELRNKLCEVRDSYARELMK